MNPGLTYEVQGRHDVTQLVDGQERTVKFDAKPVEVMSRLGREGGRAQMQSSKPPQSLVCTSITFLEVLASAPTKGSWKSKMKRQVAEYWGPRSEQRHSPSHLIQEQEGKDIPKEVM